WKHYLIQRRLRSLLEQPAGESGIVEIEFAFRALPEHEYRRADVAYVSFERCRKTEPDGYFQGAPDLAIEVLSPSNTATEILDKEKLCLENGCLQFWVVDMDRCQIKVSTPDGHTITYKSGQEIPILFGGVLSVSAVFE